MPDIQQTESAEVIMWQIAYDLVTERSQQDGRTAAALALAKEIAALYRTLWAAHVNPQNPPTVQDSK